MNLDDIMKSAFFLAVSGVLAMAAPSCRFGHAPIDEASFLRQVLESERSFFEGPGVDPETGLTRTAIKLDPKTGMPRDNGVPGGERDEAVHLQILASCLRGEGPFEGLCTDPVGTLAKKLGNIGVPTSTELLASISAIGQVLSDLYPESKLLDQIENMLGPQQIGRLVSANIHYARPEHASIMHEYLRAPRTQSSRGTVLS